MAGLVNGGVAAAGGPVDNSRDDYLAYVQACQEAGKTALPMAQWVAAGKPKG